MALRTFLHFFCGAQAAWRGQKNFGQKRSPSHRTHHKKFGSESLSGLENIAHCSWLEYRKKKKKKKKKTEQKLCLFTKSFYYRKWAIIRTAKLILYAD